MYITRNNKGLALLLAVILAVTTLLTGCGVTEPTEPASSDVSEKEKENSTAPVVAENSKEIEIQHVWGETKVPETPSNVVALDFFIVDMLVSLGISPTGIAGTGDTRVPTYIEDQVSQFTDVGERKEPNLEVIKSINPDLIIANPERAKTIKDQLERISPSIALSDKTYQVILDNVDMLGEVFGKQAEAKKVREDVENKIKAGKEKIQGHPTVLVFGVFDDELYVWVQESFVASLLTDLGADYAFEGEKGNTEGKADITALTIERLAEINPDYLFVYGSSVDQLKENPVFKNLKAVKENKLMEVEQDLWARARGPIAAGLILDEAVPFLSGAAN